MDTKRYKQAQVEHYEVNDKRRELEIAVPLPGHFANFRELFEYISSIRPIRVLTNYFKVLYLFIAFECHRFPFTAGPLLDVRQQHVRVGGHLAT